MVCNSFNFDFKYCNFEHKVYDLRCWSILNLVERLHARKKTVNCFCEHANGGTEKNGILCALAEQETGFVAGDYQKVSNCEDLEWCTGPSSSNNSIMGTIYFGKKKLCTAGKWILYNDHKISITYICVSIRWLLESNTNSHRYSLFALW